MDDRLDETGKSRVEALTDGIFAFALTVLVLNIEVPQSLPFPPPPDPVRAILEGLIPDIAHYFFAFTVLAAFWVSHHSLFNRIRHVDRLLTWLNIFGLVFIALMPFSAQLADTYTDYPLSAITFEINVLIVGIIFIAQWLYARWGGFSSSTESDGRHVMIRLFVMPGISIAAMALAASGATWTLVLYLAAPFILLATRGIPPAVKTIKR